MAKSDSFFIRGIVTSNGTTYEQSEIDLGSFVNLGVSKSTLLRIHNVSVQITDSTAPIGVIQNDGATKICHQLTTQSESGIVTANNKALICSGSMQLYNAQTAEDGSAAADFTTGFASHDFDIAPQQFTKGYLCAVDALFLGVDLSSALSTGDVKVCYVLECTLEGATQANSVALALSQQ